MSSSLDGRIPQHRKCQRRRNRGQVFAGLVLEQDLKQDIGYLSEDLLVALAPPQLQESREEDILEDSSKIYCIAISPHIDSSKIEDVTWTIVAARASKDLGAASLQFSPSSRALQSFAEDLRRVFPSKLFHQREHISVKVIDALPLSLDTIFIQIEDELAKRLEDGQGTFHGTRPYEKGYSFSNRAALPTTPEDRLASAIRSCLASLMIIHNGDAFSLPLPPHPITYVSALPAKVKLCEPVSQGVLSPHTRIVIIRTHTKKTIAKESQVLSVRSSLAGLHESEEDTSNDQFYSAAEDRDYNDRGFEHDRSMTDADTEDLVSNYDSISDDSMDDMISLPAPTLSSGSMGPIPSVQPGSPDTVRPRSQGIEHSTPGSILTSYTSDTLRPQGHRSRPFKIQALMKSLSSATLHPKPAEDEDPECRVYVDTAYLAKIGCFSGDWIQCIMATAPATNGVGLSQLDELEQRALEQDNTSWRPVKVYGLPDAYSRRRVTRSSVKRTTESRKSSFFESHTQNCSNATAYMSPILLANMENTAFCHLKPLKRISTSMKPSQSKITHGTRPPIARELHLSKILSPFSTDARTQDALIAGLQTYFKEHARIVQKGDLIPVPIDEGLSNILYHSGGSEETDALWSQIGVDFDKKGSSKPTAVGWFRVSAANSLPKDVHNSVEDVWNGSVLIDSASTVVRQSSSEMSLIPKILYSPWEYYLGLKSKATVYSASLELAEYKHPCGTKLQHRLRELIAAATSPRAIHLRMQPLAVLLVSTHRRVGKKALTTKACAELGLHLHTLDAYDIASEGASLGETKTTDLLEADARRSAACGGQFCALLVRHIEALTTERMITTLENIIANTRVLVATTTDVATLPENMRNLFSHELEMSAPDEAERHDMLKSIAEDQPIPLASDVDLSVVAIKTAALVAGDLLDVVDRALSARQLRLQALASSSSTSESPINVRDVLIAGGPATRCLMKVDFDVAVEAARKNFADAIGAPKIPNVSWDDVGGLTHVKDAVVETIQLPLERPELFAKGMKKRSGILFYGPPGTGKTLLAKAIATEFSLNFFSVKGPELLNMYIGESEANVRRVFQRARDARPCVVFFDELDSVAPKRGNQGDSGGVMDRIVSQLLAELDGMSDGEDGSGGVFVIGATNRPDLLDPALLRPGRFDKMLYLGVSDTHEKQLTILEALTRKFTLHPTLALSRIASRLPFTYTGADLYALCSDAILKSVTRQASLVDIKIQQINSTSSKPAISTAYFFDHYATGEDLAVMVTEEDFASAQRSLVPSVSVKELEHYKKVKRMFEHDVPGEAPTASRLKGKGKLVEVANGTMNGYRDANGKGKSRAMDDAPEVSHAVSLGKGKEKASLDFHEGTIDADDALY